MVSVTVVCGLVSLAFPTSHERSRPSQHVVASGSVVARPSGGGGERPAPRAFSADPAPIPVDLLLALETAGSAETDAELARFLDAVHVGFGSASAQIAPELRSYARRLEARLSVASGLAHIVVSAPTPDLAAARAASLRRIFEASVPAGTVAIQTWTGAPALSVAPD